MQFFRYQRVGNLELSMLRNREIYFAAKAELNDANECEPYYVFQGDRTLWEKLIEYIISRIGLEARIIDDLEIGELLVTHNLVPCISNEMLRQLGRKQASLSDLSRILPHCLTKCLKDKVSTRYLKFIIEGSEKFIQTGLVEAMWRDQYFASFSLSALNPTMWGHYADAEKGFVTVFSSKSRRIVFSGDAFVGYLDRENIIRRLSRGETPDLSMTDAVVHLRNIIYRKSPPRMNAFVKLLPYLNLTEAERLQKLVTLAKINLKAFSGNEVGIVKYSDWSYEREIRATICPAIDHSLPPDYRILRYPSSLISGIIFGPRTPISSIRRICRACGIMRLRAIKEDDREHDRPFFLYRAVRKSNRYKFGIEPFGVLDPYAPPANDGFIEISGAYEADRKQSRKNAELIESNL